MLQPPLRPEPDELLSETLAAVCALRDSAREIPLGDRCRGKLFAMRDRRRADLARASGSAADTLREIVAVLDEILARPGATPAAAA